MSIVSKIYRDNFFHILHRVDEEHDGMRLDQFVGMYLESFSREMIKKKIANKEIEIVKRPGAHKPSSPVHHNDEVIIKFYKSKFENEYWRGEEVLLQTTPEVIYEDKDLLVISKPAFMSTHPAGRHLFNCATVFFEMKYNHTIHSLHRIDRETSGILMLGKNPQIATAMMEHFEDDEIKKCYFFISKKTNAFNEDDFFIANERLGNPEQGLKRILVQSYPEESTQGKNARTFFYILEKNDNYVLGLACPHTGRQHQIRVHAKNHGIPLLGDKLYLGNYEMFQRFKDQVPTESDYLLMELPRHALHAVALKIPYKNEVKLFITKIPQDLSFWIEKNTSFSVLEIEKKIHEKVKEYYAIKPDEL